MLSAEQAQSAPFPLPGSLKLALSGGNGSSGERISRTVAEAGADLSETVDVGTDVLIGVHERADAEVCAEVRRHREHTPDGVVVLVLERASAGDVRRALQAGADAVVIEASIESALVPSIRAALAGHIVMPARARRGGQPEVLTTREKQILGLVVMGMSNAAIAGKLFLAESTIKSHLSSAFAKLGVSSRSEAANVILDPNSGAGLGILTIPSD